MIKSILFSATLIKYVLKVYISAIYVVTMRLINRSGLLLIWLTFIKYFDIISLNNSLINC